MDCNQTNNEAQLEPSTEQALATFEPQYAMVARSEAGYLDIAAKLDASGLLPKGMSQSQAAICMMAGGEYGLSPLKSINGFAVINNRVTPFGVTLRGICEDATLLGDLTGHVEGLGEIKYMATEDLDGTEVEVELGRALQRALRRRLARLGWIFESGKWTQTEQSQLPGNYRIGYAVLMRKDRPVRVELFDTKEAHQAGLIDRTDIWKKYQPRMLEHRAMTYALRALYADKLAGLGHTVEESDVIDTTAVEVKPAATPAATGRVLDDLATSAPPAKAAVEDAEFTERKAPPTHPAPSAPPPVEPPFEPTGPAPSIYNPPAAPPPAPAPRSEAKGEGSKALKAACDMIKAGGGDVVAMAEAASQKVLGQVKTNKSMNEDERAKVAVELGQAWRAKKEREEKERREREEEQRKATKNEDDDVDF